MPQPNQDALVQLAVPVFGQLSPFEAAVLLGVRTGLCASASPSSGWDDPVNDPAKAADWGVARQIRAELIRWLCVDNIAKDLVDPHGIQVFGASIVGLLDLSWVVVPFGIMLLRCRIAQQALMRSSNLAHLSLEGSRIESLTADGITLKGSILLRRGFCANGEIRLPGAQVGENLECIGSRFTNSGKVALNLSRIHVSGDLFLSGKSTVDGEVSILGGTIDGNFSCSDATLRNPPRKDSLEAGKALHADHLTVAGHILMTDGFTAEGTVNLISAKIGGNLSCEGAVLRNPLLREVAESGTALHADGSNVVGNVFLRKSFKAEGEVRFLGARIGRDLDCDGAEIRNAPQESSPRSGFALNADGATVGGYVFLRKEFTAEGTIKLLNAEIGGSLECVGARLDNPQRKEAPASGTALDAENLRIGGHLFLRDGLSVRGTVNISNARIGSDLICSQGKFYQPATFGADGAQLSFVGVGPRIDGSVYLDEGFQAEGQVRLLNTEIGGSLVCDGGNFGGGLMIQSSTVKGGLFWRDIVEPGQTNLDLVNTHVGGLTDNSKSWPAPGKLRLDGFIYDRLSAPQTPRSAEARLDWLGREKDLALQPYRQLAGVLRYNGDEIGSRKVLFRMECLRRSKQNEANWFLFVGDRVLRWTIGYGYYPGNCLWWLLSLTVVCAALFWGGYVVGSVAPTDKEAYSQLTSLGRLPDHYERFHASIYALENSFPLLRLGQAERWQPDPMPWKQGGVTHRDGDFFRSALTPGFLRWLRWVQICLGWFFATMFVASVSGVVHKE